MVKLTNDPYEAAEEGRQRRAAGCSAANNSIETYLGELRGFPLLTPDEEQVLAKELAVTRRRPGRAIFGTDFMLRGAADLLARVHDGRLRLDRTLNVDSSDLEAKGSAIQRLTTALEASKRVLRRNRADFELTRNRRAEAAKRRSARRRLIIRRRKAYRRIRQIEQQAVKKLRRSKHRRSLLDFLDRDPDCAPGDSL